MNSIEIRRHHVDLSNLTKFSLGKQADKITRLMGCLCYTKRLERSPYADLLAESQWDAIAQEFVRQCCGLMGLVRSALAGAVTAALDQCCDRPVGLGNHW